MTARDTFFDIITPAHLYAGALVFLVLTFVTVSVIYTFLHIRKKRFRAKEGLNDELDDWIGYLLSEDADTAITTPPAIAKYMGKENTRQLIIDKLVTIKKNITGFGSHNIERAYIELGLLKDSVNKMNAYTWHIKARGIYELYMMGQHAMYPEIMKHTNHGNKFVRREAQAAIIGFAGFKGLVFLDTLTKPMLEWQQLKLLEKLQTENATTLDRLPRWLQSDNIYVMQFALKLAQVYTQYPVHDIVVTCLRSEHEHIRAQAIKTLGSIPADNTASMLQTHYATETQSNRRLILEQLADIGSIADYTFLTKILSGSDNMLKLEAARAIATIDHDGWRVLAEYSTNDEVLATISEQLKKELSA